MLIKDKVKDLINLGYDMDVIGEVLGISDTQVALIKNQIDNDSKENKIQKSREKSKLQILRKRYNAVYHTKNPASRGEGHVLTSEEISEISAHIDTIESRMQEILNMTCKDKNDIQRQRYKVSNMLKEFSDIDNIDLPIDLLQRVYSIFPTDKLYKVMDIHAKDGIERKQGHYIIKYANSFHILIPNIVRLNFFIFYSPYSNYIISSIKKQVLHYKV